MTTVPQICSVEGCGRKTHAGSMCQTHYKRLKSGKPLDTPVRAYGQISVCSVEGCDKPHSCKGLCDGHYQRLRNGNDVSTPLAKRNQEGCEVLGCDNPHSAKGYCTGHYQRLQTSTPLDSPVKELVRGRTGCDTLGCDEPHKANGYCSRCNLVWTVYKLDPNKWMDMRKQGCAICGTTERRLVVDHDHSCCPGPKSCGECVRGALCGTCNTGLGSFRDDPANLEAAIGYLTGWQEMARILESE